MRRMRSSGAPRRRLFRLHRLLRERKHARSVNIHHSSSTSVSASLIRRTEIEIIPAFLILARHYCLSLFLLLQLLSPLPTEHIELLRLQWRRRYHDMINHNIENGQHGFNILLLIAVTTGTTCTAAIIRDIPSWRP